MNESTIALRTSSSSDMKRRVDADADGRVAADGCDTNVRTMLAPDGANPRHAVGTTATKAVRARIRDAVVRVIFLLLLTIYCYKL
eukprot:scaffold6304_cov44-Attheya_sp.AAC.4